MIANETTASKRRRLPGQEYVVVSSVAAHCMVSRATVRRWVLEGKLSATKLPSGHFRISLLDFKDFLTQYDMRLPKELSDSSR